MIPLKMCKARMEILRDAPQMIYATQCAQQLPERDEMGEPQAKNDALEPGEGSGPTPSVPPHLSDDDVAEATRWGRVYLIWAVVGLVLAILACCLMYIGELGAGFLVILATLILSCVAQPETNSAKERESRLHVKALELQPVLEQQVREWKVIVEDLENMRESFRRWNNGSLAQELERLLDDARHELKKCRKRKKEHGETFDMAYYVLQRRDERGRPRKYIVHGGLCPRRKGEDKHGIFGSAVWCGPYKNWQDAHGLGTRRYCTFCCSDLPVEGLPSAK